jgi:uncharacterized membrane protein YgcG
MTIEAKLRDAVGRALLRRQHYSSHGLAQSAADLLNENGADLVVVFVPQTYKFRLKSR